MKDLNVILRTVRTALLPLTAALSSLALTAGLLAASPAPPLHGSLGQALALRASLRPLTPSNGHVKSFQDLGVPTDTRHASDGRYIAQRPNAAQPGRMRSGAILRAHAAGGAQAQVDEAVQTFDVFNPPPAFALAQGASLNPTNLTPVWTADETILVFSSNRTATGTAGTRFHIWAIPINGGAALQLTSSTAAAGETAGTAHGEFFPTLSAGNNNQLAFTSDANTANVQNLYVIPFAAKTVTVGSTLTSPTYQGLNASAVPVTGINGVGRPAFSPADANVLVFSGLSVTGTNAGHRHIYFVAQRNPTQPSLPAKLTNGPADDTDPSYSQDGQYIAFASTASGLTATGAAPNSDPNSAPLVTAAAAGTTAGSNRAIFLMTSSAAIANAGKPVTAAGTDDFAPAWSSAQTNPYLNAAPGFEYIAFSRGLSQTAPHDIFYLQVLQNTQAGGESGRSNEASSTPLNPRAPVYQINAGGDTIGGFASDSISSISVIGGTADAAATPPVVYNTTADPGTPPGIYQTDRSGTFSYIFPNLTPAATYLVRLHLADAKNTAPGKRIFTVSANGSVIAPAGAGPNIDIVGTAQQSPGRVDGLVTDASTNLPLPGATLTITPSAAGGTTTTVTTGDAVADPNPSGTGQVNYNAPIVQGSYTVVASAPNYGSLSRVISVNSGSYTRADFNLSPGTATFSGTVVDTNGVGVSGATISVVDAATGGAVVTSPASVTASATTGSYGTVTVAPGTYYITATPPAGSGFTTATQTVTVAAATPSTVNFTLQNTTSARVGSLGGVVSNSATGAALSNATVTVLGAGGTVVAILPTGGSSTPAAPNGDGKAVNYFANLPVGTYTLQFAEPGYTTATKSVSVVNTTTGTAPTAFVRGDQVLTPTTAAAGQPVAIVLEYLVTAATNDSFDKNGLVIAPSGAITLSFNPVSGDPPIVQGIEILSDPAAQFSSGFGSLSTTRATAGAPQLSVFGGTNTVDANGNPLAVGTPQLTLQIFNFGATSPSAYNIYRSPALPTASNRPPANGSGTEAPALYLTVPASGFTVIDTTNTTLGTDVTLGSEYYYQVTAVYKLVLAPESDANPAVQLNTSDPGNVYDDVYPTWAPFRNVFSIAYSSNRSVTYNVPGTGAASETAISIGANGSLGNGGTVSAAYAGILESQVLNLDPPTLVPFSGNEICHVNTGAGYNAANIARTGITPGQPITVTVRLSSREAGVDPNNVYLQIKDPDSKYQDSQNIEHKVFAHDRRYRRQRNNPNLGQLDSGSSDLLMNGGGYAGYNQFAGRGGNFVLSQRGAVGGIDGAESGTNTAGVGAGPGPSGNKSDSISVGRNGGGTNPGQVFDAAGKPVVDANKFPVALPGGDPSLFVPTGPEFECQAVNPSFAGPDTLPSDYTNPYYLAGVDDQLPFSGNSTTYRPSTEWLHMAALPAAQQDGQGGLLYSVTLTTPTSPSDYYLDVIAYDKAIAPRVSAVNGGGSNWRIYDNIWGLSTASFDGSRDILLVSDYTLGQKFATTTFGGQRGLLNLVPKLFGAESYVSDIDDSLLPNAIYRNAVFPGANPDNPQPEVLDLSTSYNPADSPRGSQNTYSIPAFALNGLGVNSYYDRFIDDLGRNADGAPKVRSQLYSLWRTLARGPVPPSIYAAYEPTLQSQPAVSDAGGAKPITVAAGIVPVATKCIVWISPFTGDVLAGPGTLIDSATQANLRAFVAAGGRLCVSGQDVGSALTQNGTTANTTGGFLSDVLNATLVSSNQGTHIPVGGIDPVNNRISYEPNYDGILQGGYQEVNTIFGQTTTAPSQRLIRISNNYGGNVFEASFQVNLGYLGNWRTDGSLDQLGPYIQSFPKPFSFLDFIGFQTQSNNTNSVVGQIDTIKPNAGANVHTDLTLGAFTNPIPPTDAGNDAAASAPGGVGLIYSENPIGAAGGTGSKVVYATFGLEALSTEYYKQTLQFKPNPILYAARNQRQNILHSIVSYLRTGSISGTIRATSGNNSVGAGIAGATVYVQSAYGAAIPGRGTFSATTDAAGNYSIGGLEPGNYTLVAYRTGYNRATSNPGTVLTVEGDVAVTGANLTLVQGNPGTLTGVVTDASGKPVAGASVTFTSADGQTQPAPLTDATGTYTLSNVPPGTYTGTAVLSGASAGSAAVAVASGSTVTVNFKLAAGKGSATGRVVDTAGTGLSGASVFFSGGGLTTPATAATDATGTYTIPPNTLPAGTYLVSATKTGYGNSTPVQVVITSATVAQVPDITLGIAVNGTLGGLVTTTSNSAPAGGVTITIVSAATGATNAPATTTTATAIASPDGNGTINYGPVTLLQGTYTVTATVNGVSTAPQTVTIPANGFARLDFTGVSGLPPVHTFPAGLQFVSAPYDYSALGFTGLFGTLNTSPAGTASNGNRSNVAVWNPLSGAYALDPNAPADALRLGVGYWVYLKAATPVTQAGTAPTGTVSVPLNPAWNQIGVPSATGVPVSSLTFIGADGVSRDFATATGSTIHLASSTLYYYDGTAYQTVGAGGTLQPWQAYWIRVFTPVTLGIPTGK